MIFKEAKTNPEILTKASTITQNNLLAKIIANRTNNPTIIGSIVKPSGKLLIKNPDIYDNTIKQAAELLLDTLTQKGRIVVVTDSDCDGVSCAAISKLFFKKAYGIDVKVIVNERRFGNGVNAEMIRRLLIEHNKEPIALVLTGDHGSSDDIRYKTLHEHNIKVLVTDHHLLPTENKLINVDGFVNPHGLDTTLNKNLSGCAVLYLLFKALEDSIDPKDPELDYLLPIVAMSTVVDQMSLQDPLNRYFFKRGMDIIEQGDDELWVLYLKKTNAKFARTTEFFSRGIGPIINAANRMGKPWLAYKFLTARSEDELTHYLSRIVGLNSDRKDLQKELMKQIVSQVKLANESFNHTITAILPGAEGIVGVLASMIGEQNLKPTFIFSIDGDILSGSGRSILNTVSVRKTIDYVRANSVGIILKGGGHKGAGGVKIPRDRYQDFIKLFEASVEEQTGGLRVDHIEYDFMAPLQYLNDNMFNLIHTLEPFGQQFPIVKIRTTVKFDFIKRLGISTAYLSKISNNGIQVEAIMFKPPEDKALQGKTKDVIIRLYEKHYRGNTSLGYEILEIID